MVLGEVIICYQCSSRDRYNFKVENVFMATREDDLLANLFVFIDIDIFEFQDTFGF